MEIRDIVDWASSEIKTVEITQGFGDARYTLELRPFNQKQGDTSQKSWVDGSVTKVHDIPAYAIANMEMAARTLENYVDRSIGSYIAGAMGKSDEWIWQTYGHAFYWVSNAPVSAPRCSLLNNF